MNRWILPNGLVVLYAQEEGVPLAGATLLLRSGNSRETPEEAGLASFTADMLLTGTRRRSAQQIGAVMESVGASLGVQCAEDYNDVGFITPASELKRGLGIMADIVANAVFPKDEMKKERAQILAALRSRQDSIFTIAHDRWGREAYGSHPYGRPVDGFAETVERFSRDDLRRWQETYWSPSEAILSINAALPLKTVRAMVSESFGSWKVSKTPRRPPASPPAPWTGHRRVGMPSRFEQAYLMTGFLAPAIGEPDFLALKILNMVLGGGMSSRLFVQLREELGLAYEVSSFFPTRRQTSEWVLYLGLSPDKRDVAAERLEAILKTVSLEGVTSREVEQAKHMMKGSFLMERQTRRRRAWYAAWWEFLGYKADFERSYARRMDSVTTDHVNAVARKMLSQPRLTVEVGPAA